VKQVNVSGEQASPFEHSECVEQQVTASAAQQTPFSHFRPGKQLPCPEPVHEYPVPTMSAHAWSIHPYPSKQSSAPVQLVAHAATG
jgi:hypothetical protein